MKTQQITVKISGSLTALENAAAILNQSFPVAYATGTPRKCVSDKTKEPQLDENGNIVYFQFLKCAVPVVDPRQETQPQTAQQPRYNYTEATI